MLPKMTLDTSHVLNDAQMCQTTNTQRHSESDCHVMWDGVRRTTPSSGADRKSSEDAEVQALNPTFQQCGSRCTCMWSVFRCFLNLKQASTRWRPAWTPIITAFFKLLWSVVFFLSVPWLWSESWMWECCCVSLYLSYRVHFVIV